MGASDPVECAASHSTSLRWSSVRSSSGVFIAAPIARGDRGATRQGRTVSSVDEHGLTTTLACITLSVSGVITDFTTKNGNFPRRERRGVG